LPKIKPFKESYRESLRNIQKSLINENNNSDLKKYMGVLDNLKMGAKNKNVINLNPLPIPKSILNLDDRNSNPYKSSP